MDANHVGARLLVVDDDPNICRALDFALRSQGYEVQTAYSAERALEVVEGWLPDLFIVDVKLPHIDGLTLLTRLREDERFLHTPVILLTAMRTDAASKVQGLNLGANDYMEKPFSLDELMARVGTNLRMARLTQRLEELTSRLTDLASRDSLTGLHHHGKIVEQLSMEALRATHQGTALSCAMLDLDRFKHINDAFGHQAGDDVIVQVARILLGNCRKTDHVGRYGGDEFLIVLPQAGAEGARSKAEDIRARIAQLSIPSLPRTQTISASFGVASAASVDDLVADALIRRADQALYEAKARGGNSVVSWAH